MQGQQTDSKDFSWPFWYVVPMYPYGRRRTLRQEVVKDSVWTFDQLQGIFYVVVPIRMTVVKLDDGGLLVYAPVAPTPECVRLVNELVAVHGEIKYIILPTASGLEHKVFVGPFARCFPTAQIFIAPGQWSFPLNLPLSWLGLPRDRTQILPEDCRQAPFASQFDYEILGPLKLGLGGFTEVAFLDRRSNTLLVTDSVISIPTDPPAILQLDPYPLLFHAKDSASDLVENNSANRRKGWQRISLFATYFVPSALNVVEWNEMLRRAFQASDRSRQAYFGLFPFDWKDHWQQSFEILRGHGRLLVAPVLQSLILNRDPKATLAWADRVASWDFQRIIPCHFDRSIEVQPDQFRQAFSFLEDSINPDHLPNQDFQTLKQLESFLNQRGILPPV